MMRKLRRALLALLIVCAVLAGLVLGGSGWVVWQGRDRVLSEEDAPGAPFDCILVLGCGVYADGTPTPMLNDRIHTGAALYAHGWSGTVLMSGDNRAEDYNEVGTMRTVAEGLILSLILIAAAGPGCPPTTVSTARGTSTARGGSSSSPSGTISTERSTSPARSGWTPGACPPPTCATRGSSCATCARSPPGTRRWSGPSSSRPPPCSTETVERALSTVPIIRPLIAPAKAGAIVHFLQKRPRGHGANWTGAARKTHDFLSNVW